MQSNDVHAIRSVVAYIRSIAHRFLMSNGHPPTVLRLSPALADSLKAELLVTGQIRPGVQMNFFEGMRIEISNLLGASEVQ